VATNDAPEVRALDLVKQWLQQGAGLREQLEAEEALLTSRLREVREALAKMPSAETGKPTPPAASLPSVAPAPPRVAVSNDEWMSRLRSQDLTAPDLVLAVLARKHRWMSALEILAAAQEVKADIEATIVHSAIYRLVKAGRIQSRGTKRSMTYAPLGEIMGTK